MPRAAPAERIRKLEEQRARINAKIQRVRTRESVAERKRETCRLILMGDMALAKVARGEWSEDCFLAAMDAFLAHPRDRALFGLPPRLATIEAVRPPSPTPTQQARSNNARRRVQRRRRRKRKQRKT